MRKIERIIVHCSASPRWTTIEHIDRWHKERGWSGVGYHYVIESFGAIKIGRPLHEIGAHAHGYNSTSIGICLIGGLWNGVMQKFDDKQFDSLNKLITNLLGAFGHLDVIGHRDVNPHKECPCFDVKEWLKGEQK